MGGRLSELGQLGLYFNISPAQQYNFLKEGYTQIAPDTNHLFKNSFLILSAYHS